MFQGCSYSEGGKAAFPFHAQYSENEQQYTIRFQTASFFTNVYGSFTVCPEGNVVFFGLFFCFFYMMFKWRKNWSRKYFFLCETKLKKYTV